MILCCYHHMFQHHSLYRFHKVSRNQGQHQCKQHLALINISLNIHPRYLHSRHHMFQSHFLKSFHKQHKNSIQVQHKMSSLLFDTDLSNRHRDFNLHHHKFHSQLNLNLHKVECRLLNFNLQLYSSILLHFLNNQRCSLLNPKYHRHKTQLNSLSSYFHTHHTNSNYLHQECNLNQAL